MLLLRTVKKIKNCVSKGEMSQEEWTICPSSKFYYFRYTNLCLLLWTTFSNVSDSQHVRFNCQDFNKANNHRYMLTTSMLQHCNQAKILLNYNWLSELLKSSLPKKRKEIVFLLMREQGQMETNWQNTEISKPFCSSCSIYIATFLLHRITRRWKWRRCRGGVRGRGKWRGGQQYWLQS